ncbi:LysR family transcriptional regulator [Verticiella sediminum]|uniref:LysR family transcriptional regulator n=1 Tax=Verticiella sediminum TaxID=1247510 RepID=A0A556AGP8_9BURK|nr:LysR family transcriptional regulator [Verticiella sediminum]TSH92033.1 LysR family transcriptional regulator [Verticiella sediminum]
MDLRRIRQFVVLSEVLNFRRAAERLHMTQPALSVSIQKLEADLGVALFRREASGVALTHSGQAALLEARRAIFHGEQFVEAARAANSGEGGILRIGFVGSTTYALLPKLVPRFRTDHPRVRLVLSQATSERIMHMLDEDALDIGLVRTPVVYTSGATLVQLEREDFVAALPVGHPHAGRPRLRLQDLQEEPFLMYSEETSPGLRAAAMSACQSAGFFPQLAQEATQVHTLLALVESGLGIALVPSVMERFSSDKVAIRRLSDLPAPGSIALALAYKAEMESPAARRFREVAAAAFPRR